MKKLTCRLDGLLLSLPVRRRQDCGEKALRRCGEERRGNGPADAWESRDLRAPDMNAARKGNWDNRVKYAAERRFFRAGWILDGWYLLQYNRMHNRREPK